MEKDFKVPEGEALHQRRRLFQKISASAWDVLVIGGGITGAGIALDAASRGLRVLLVEKADFASGTSSRSTKLIHGGLRYLKNLELGLVRSTGRERAINHRMAPLRVYPAKMLLPLRKGGSLSPLTARLAIGLYDFLARVDRRDRLRMLNVQETLEWLPRLRTEGLQGAALYTEYQTDDARLTLDILRTAQGLGAVVINYLEASVPLYTASGRLAGYRLSCALTGAQVEIQSLTVVSAAGPWSDIVRQRHGQKTPLLRLSRGIHIVVPASRLPLSVAVYMDVPTDPGRMIFCIPRRGHVYVGTTDHYFEGAPDAPDVPHSEILYLLDAVNQQMSLSPPLGPQDVISYWSGLRPLIRRPGHASTDVSRKDELKVLPDGLLWIAGGKLTGWRLMARRVTDACCQILHRHTGKKYGPCRTDEIVLQDQSLPDHPDRDKFLATLEGWAAQLPDGPRRARELGEIYGGVAPRILNRAYELFSEDRMNQNPILAAEVEWVVQNEWAWFPEDYFERRSGKRFFNAPAVAEEVETVRIMMHDALSRPVSREN